MTTRRADVAVVGAGVVGCATAYYLAKAGVRVALVDRDGVGRHASGFAYGGLYPLSGAGVPGPMHPLATKSFALHRDLAEALPEETGIATGFRERSTVGLAFNNDEAADLRANVAWVKRATGLPRRLAVGAGTA